MTHRNLCKGWNEATGSMFLSCIGEASFATSGSMHNLNSGWGHNLLAGVFQYGCTTWHLEKVVNTNCLMEVFCSTFLDGRGSERVAAFWASRGRLGSAWRCADYWSGGSQLALMLQDGMSCGGKRWHNELKWQILLGHFWYGPSKLMIGIICLVLPFFCSVLVPWNIYIYYDTGLSTFEQRHCVKPSCKNQRLTFKLRNRCNLRIPALSNLNLCAPRMLFEDDPEDLQDGLEPLELPKKRLILVPLADREDCCGVGTFRSWNGLDHFLIIQVANLAVWNNVIIWSLFSFFYIFLVLEYSSDSNERLQPGLKLFQEQK